MKNIDGMIKKAQAGDIDACLNLGVFYHSGKNKDMSKAVYWLEKAAGEKNAGAQLLLGVIYYKAMDVPVDEEKGIKLIELAAESGEKMAVRTLGDIAREKGDIEKSFIYYQKAAEKEDRKALYNIGIMYLRGIGTEKNEKMAREYIYQAAQLKHSPAIKKHEELLDKLIINHELKGLKELEEVEEVISRMPKQYPFPCSIVLMKTVGRESDAHGNLENDEYVLGGEIVKKFELSRGEYEKLVFSIKNTEQYTIGGNVGSNFKIAFIFGENKNEVRVLVDYEQRWILIKKSHYLLALGLCSFESKDNLSLLVLTKDLANKYFTDYFYLLKE